MVKCRASNWFLGCGGCLKPIHHAVVAMSLMPLLCKTAATHLKDSENLKRTSPTQWWMIRTRIFLHRHQPKPAEIHFLAQLTPETLQVEMDAALRHTAEKLIDQGRVVHFASASEKWHRHFGTLTTGRGLGGNWADPKSHSKFPAEDPNTLFVSAVAWGAQPVSLVYDGTLLQQTGA